MTYAGCWKNEGGVRGVKRGVNAGYIRIYGKGAQLNKHGTFWSFIDCQICHCIDHFNSTRFVQTIFFCCYLVVQCQDMIALMYFVQQPGIQVKLLNKISWTTTMHAMVYAWQRFRGLILVCFEAFVFTNSHLIHF